MSLHLREEVLLAESRIRPHVRETILEHVPWLSGYGARVFCKLENLQYTGSFKVRGALNKLLSLTSEERMQGIVAASTGNHGVAVAYSLKMFNAPGLVFVPENTPLEKVKIILRLGAEVRRHGYDTAHAEAYARRYAAENQLTFVSPYNDPQVIAGQGTIGPELCRQLDRVDVVLASVGGGGLITGIASYLRHVRPRVRIIGCSPENSQVMVQSVKAGRILDLPSIPTLSEGTAGGVEPNAITFDLCRELVDDYITVSEDEIGESLRQFIQNQHMLIEGAAAVSVASYLKSAEHFPGKNVVIIICGANITLDALARVLTRDAG